MPARKLTSQLQEFLALMRTLSNWARVTIVGCGLVGVDGLPLFGGDGDDGARHGRYNLGMT